MSGIGTSTHYATKLSADFSETRGQHLCSAALSKTQFPTKSACFTLK